MKLWITPVNDGEAVEIRNLLSDHYQKVVVTHQPWGATWQALEVEVEEQIENLLRAHPDAEVIGVELGGPCRWNGRNIDHHRYSGDDRSNPKSSLQQVADELGVELNRHQQLVCANDVGYIPGMLALNATEDEIKVIREQDRCAQGITPDDEARAVRDLNLAKWKGTKVLIYLATGQSSTPHLDRMFGHYTEVLTAATDRWIYFGPRHQELDKMNFVEHHWCGGANENGYFGIITPSDATQEAILKFFWK